MIAWYCMYTPYFQPLPNIIFFHILVGIVRLYPIKCPILSFPIFAPLGSRTSICFHHLCLHEAGRTGDAAERGVLERHHLTVAVQTGLALELWRISPRRFRGFRWNLEKCGRSQLLLGIDYKIWAFIIVGNGWTLVDYRIRMNQWIANFWEGHALEKP